MIAIRGDTLEALSRLCLAVIFATTATTAMAAADALPEPN